MRASTASTPATISVRLKTRRNAGSARGSEMTRLASRPGTGSVIWVADPARRGHELGAPPGGRGDTLEDELHPAPHARSVEVEIRQRAGDERDPVAVRGGQLVGQPAAHEAIHGEPGPQQHEQHDARQHEGEAEREGAPATGAWLAHGASSRAATSRYPVDGIVSISQGSPASSASFLRRFATWTSTTRS